MSSLPQHADHSQTLLHAVTHAARIMFSHASLHQSITEVLTLVGEASALSRIYLFEMETLPNAVLVTHQRYEWCAPGITPQIDSPDLQNLPMLEAGLERWITVLGNNTPVYGKVADLPDSERAILAAQAILSIAVVPIMVGEQWWGFIGFDDCENPRTWTPIEIETLQAVAAMIGGILYSEQRAAASVAMQQQLIAAQERVIRELSTPLIPIADDVVIMPIIGQIDAARAQQMTETLLNGVAAQQASTVLLDVTGVQAIDTRTANAFIGAAQAVRLLGARVILTGIQPAIANTLVQLGIDLTQIDTRRTLQDGIAAVLHQSQPLHASRAPSVY